jgi:circadian clock protein KaiB
VPEGEDSLDDFSPTRRVGSTDHYVLHLHVAGASAVSRRAVANLSTICENELVGRYTLEVIDVYQQPDLAVAEQIVATPTLVRLSPEPVIRLVGNLADRDTVVRALGLARSWDSRSKFPSSVDDR